MPSTATGSPDRVPGRRPSLRLALGGLAGALALSLGLAGHAAAIPSAEVVYGPSLPSSLDQYAAPGNVIVVTAEQRNRNPNRIRAWRAKGAIVLAYVNLVDYQQPQDPIENDLYGGAFPQSWFYPGNLSNFGGRRLLNLEDNSPVATYNGFTGTWGQYAAHWIRNEVIKDGSLFNGVFLDVWGDQLYNVNVGGPGSHWEAGVARWGQEIRNQVGPNIFLVGNNTQTPKTAAPLNGRMWESFSSQPAGSYNDLTGQGTHPGLRYVFPWPQWSRPRLDILWRNEAGPSGDTKSMLMSAARSVSQTGTDIAIGAGDLGTNFPAPFGDGGSAPPGSGVPAPPPAASTPAPAKKATGGGFTLSAAQLRINQRIGQAAIRRLHVVRARLHGRPAPARRHRHRDAVRLRAAQMLINQRIYQAAIRRAAVHKARLDHAPAPRFGPGEGDLVRLTLDQLITNQRIAQAAVRRANSLVDRVS
jgi:hypothetical protein